MKIKNFKIYNFKKKNYEIICKKKVFIVTKCKKVSTKMI